ncbi:thioredoxin family protein [bacterium]|nr:thioredoxin family protein [bacterium]
MNKLQKMQKKTTIFLITLTVISFLITNSSAQATWINDYDQALKDAKQHNRPILINFTGSDLCDWCVRLKKEVFSKPTFKDYADNNLILLELDFSGKKPQSPKIKKQNNELAMKYAVRGFPTIILINEKGDIIARTGYRRGGPAKYIEHLKKLISQN